MLLLKSKGDQISFIEEHGKKIKVMNWHGFNVQIGSFKSPFFFNEIQNRRNRNKSNIIVITGSPGEGKTYFGIRLAEIFDKKFNPKTQIVFTRPQLLHVIGEKSPLKRGQVIVIDEAHYGMGSRRWMENVQKDLMDALASVRSRGYVIIIVCLHIQMLDVIIRKYVLSFMIHMEDRGVGIAYRLYTPRFAKELYKTRLGKVRLLLPNAEICDYPDCLECEHNKMCYTTRAIYERRKKSFVDESSKQAEDRAIEREKMQKRTPIKKGVQLLLDHWDELNMNNQGNIERVSAYMVIEKHLGEHFGTDKLNKVCKLAQLERTRNVKE